MDTSNEITQRIKEKRISLDLSYQQLAEKTGMSKSTLQRYETGFIRNLPVDKLEILAKALQTTPAYLMGWEDEEKNKVEKTDTINNEFKNSREAMEFILKQPALMAYGGYDIKKMSENDLIEFANDLLKQLELLSYKYKK